MPIAPGKPPRAGRAPPHVQDCAPKTGTSRGQPSGTVGTEPGGDILPPWLSLCHLLGMGPRGRGQSTALRGQGQVGVWGSWPRRLRNPERAVTTPVPMALTEQTGAECRQGVEGRAPRALMVALPYGPAIPARVHPEETSPRDIGTPWSLPRVHGSQGLQAACVRQQHRDTRDGMLLGHEKDPAPCDNIDGPGGHHAE